MNYITNRSTRRAVKASRYVLGAVILTAATAPAQVPSAAPPASASAPPATAAPMSPQSTTPTAPPAAAPATTPPTQTSYLFGLTFGEQMHAVGIADQVDVDTIARGIRDGLSGKKSTRADQQQIQQFVQSIMAAAAARNKAAAQEFLARNGQQKGVKTTASGLQYRILLPGDAKAPVVNATDEVSVNYRGKLLDGTEFDSSYARNAPATFKVNGVIKGWQEALVMMKPGAKWQLFIPADLAYGSSTRPGIPAESLLTFEVDLISAKPAAAQLPAPESHKAVAPPPSPSTNQTNQ